MGKTIVGGVRLIALIHFNRIGRGVTIYQEGLLEDNGTRLDTRTDLPPNSSKVWSKSLWHQMGILNHGEVVATVCKHHFYLEWFDIIELLNTSGELLGYYCDICTPLVKENNQYYIQDLFLDLWVFPDGSYRELDWDEFEEAVTDGIISDVYQQKAIETLNRLVLETQKGFFPGNYLPIKPQW